MAAARKARWLAVPLAALTYAMGCGGDRSPSAPAPPTTPAPANAGAPSPSSPTPEAGTVAHSAAPAPPQAAETASEAAEGGEGSTFRTETANAADPPAPAPPPDDPGGGSGEEEEEEEKEGEAGGAAEGEGEEGGSTPRQKVPCDQVGSADISARVTSDTTVDLTWSFSTEPECEQFVTFSISRDGTTLTPDSTRSHTDTGQLLDAR